MVKILEIEYNVNSFNDNTKEVNVLSLQPIVHHSKINAFGA